MSNLQVFNQKLSDEKTQQYLERTLNNKKDEFVANMASLVNSNPKLQECDFMTLLNCGIKATALNLSLDSNLGLSYAIPYKNKGKVEAQFQIGYKGLIQLAMRSGEFAKIHTTKVKAGEIKGQDFLTGDLQFEWIQDPNEREKVDTIGYVAYFKLVNGYEHIFYMTLEEVINHADEYSMAFKKTQYEALKSGKVPQSEMWKYSSPWYKNFDLMAEKTVLKLLLNKYAPKSITTINDAIKYDQAVIKNVETDDIEYVDVNVEETGGEVQELIDVEVVNNDTEQEL